MADKGEKEIKIIDIAIIRDARICDKEPEQIEKDRQLKDEISKVWITRRVFVILVVVGILGE